MATLELSAFDPNAVVSPDSVALVEGRIRDNPTTWSAWSRTNRSSGVGCLVPFVVLLGAALLCYLGMVITGQLDWDAVLRESIGAAITLGVAFGILTLLFVGAVGALVGAVQDPRNPEALVRVLRFARDNGLEFSAQSPADDFHGRVWDDGTTHRLDHLTGPDIDYGTVGRTGRHSMVEDTGIGYLAIRLQRKLPHLVLMRRRGAVFYAGDGPEFELEGDFGRHFELHVPPGYERDALAVLTPDVMQVLIDEAADRRVEIVDDRLFVFGERNDLTAASTHVRMHRIAAAIAGEIVPQTDTYRDERIVRDPRDPRSPDRVAVGGRRLAGVVWVPGVLLAIAIGSSPFWGAIADALTGLGGP